MAISACDTLSDIKACVRQGSMGNTLQRWRRGFAPLQSSTGNPPGRKRGRSGGRARHRIDDVVHHLDNKVAVVALAHDPDDRLGPGRADDEPATVAEALAGRLDDVDHRLLLQGLALLVAHVLQNLRQRLKTVADLAVWFV